MSARAYDFDYLDLNTSADRVPVFIGNDSILRNPDRPRHAEPKDQAKSALNDARDMLMSHNNEARALYWSSLNEIVEKGAAAIRRQDHIADVRGALRTESRNAASVNPMTDAQTDAIIAFSHVESMVSSYLQDAARSNNAINPDAMLENLRVQALDHATGAGGDRRATIASLVERTGGDTTPFFDRSAEDLQALYDQSVRVIYNETAKVTDVLAFSYAAAGREAVSAELNRLSAIEPALLTDAERKRLDTADAELEALDSEQLTVAERARLTMQILRSGTQIDYAPQRESNERDIEFVVTRAAASALINDYEFTPSERRIIETQLDAAASGHPVEMSDAVRNRTKRFASVMDQADAIIQSPEFARYKAVAGALITGVTAQERSEQIAQALSGGNATRIRGLDQLDIVASSVAEAAVISRLLDFVAINRGDRVPSRETIGALLEGVQTALSHSKTVRQPTRTLMETPRYIITEGPNGKTADRIHPYWEAYRAGKNRADKALNALGQTPRDENGVALREAPPTLGYLAVTAHAFLGPNASRLQMEAIGLEGAKYFKHPDVITTTVNDVAAQNAKVKTSDRVPLIAIADANARSKNDHSRSAAAILAAATAAGMSVLRVEASLDPKDMLRLNAGGALVDDKSNRGWLAYNIVAENGDKIPLYSSRAKYLAQQNKAGSLLLLDPKPPSSLLNKIEAARSPDQKQRLTDQYDRMKRTIAWQALQSLTTQTTVFGLTDKDFNACQATRRSMDFDKKTTVYDEDGKPMAADRAYALARIGAPKARDNIAQGSARSVYLGRDVEQQMTKPAASQLGRLALAFLTSTKDAERIAGAAKALRVKHSLENPISIRDLVDAATLTGDKYRDLEPQKAAVMKDLIAAIGTDRSAFQSAKKVGYGMQYAMDSVLQMSPTISVGGVNKANSAYLGDNSTIAITGPLVEAANQPLTIHGNPDLIEKLGRPDVAIIGSATSTPDEKMAKVITDLVQTAGEKGQTISTTNDPTGELVINAARNSGATIMVVVDPAAKTGLSAESRAALNEMISQGRALEVAPSLPPLVDLGQRGSERDGDLASRWGALNARFAATATQSRIRALETAVAPAKAVTVAATRANDPALFVAARAGQDKRMEPIGGKPVAVIAASPTRMLRADQQGGLELLKPNRSVMIDTGHSTIMTNASVGVRFVDSNTGETDRSGRERGQEFFGMKARAIASWVNPAKPIADAKQATAFLTAVAEGKAEPMHGKFRKGMTAADIALLTGAVRHPTENEKKFAAIESRETSPGIDWNGTIQNVLSKSFRVTTRGAGREAFA